MLRIEQMESSEKEYVVIDLDINGTLKFHGVFEPCNVDESTLKPMKNGLKMEIDLDD